MSRTGQLLELVTLHLHAPRPPTLPLCAGNMSGLEAILSNPAYHDYLAILKGARNGFVYGVKVRFPHALIMAVLFGRGESVTLLDVSNYEMADHGPFSWMTRLRTIYRATRQHALNLAKFVSLYFGL